MCLSCHLPTKDVAANQPMSHGRSFVRSIGSRTLGLFMYGGIVAWCWYRIPDSLSFVVPGAVVGAALHVIKGRAWLGLLLFFVVVAAVPALFWPAMLTGFVSDVTGGS
jgi:hypothetical protein